MSDLPSCKEVFYFEPGKITCEDRTIVDHGVFTGGGIEDPVMYALENFDTPGSLQATLSHGAGERPKGYKELCYYGGPVHSIKNINKQKKTTKYLMF